MDFQFTQLACDEDASRILSIASHRGVSIKDISEALDIPMSRCYRRVHEMFQRGMLKVEYMDENRATLYRSNVKSFFITFENERLSLMVEYDDGNIQSYLYNVGSESAMT